MYVNMRRKNREHLILTIVLIFFCVSFYPLNAQDINDENTNTENAIEVNTHDENLNNDNSNGENKEASFSQFNWAVTGSIFHFAAKNGVDSDPSPILPSLGASLSWQFHKFVRLEFTEDLYFTNYEYNTTLNYPMACNPENRSAFVFGFITAIQITAVIPLGAGGIFMRIFAGPAMDIRIVTLAVGLKHPADFTGDIETDPQVQTDAIRNHFWGKGRWFMPVAGIGFDFPAMEKLLFGFDLRVWFPIYKLWTDDNTPKIDGWRFGIGFRVTPAFEPKSKKDKSTAPL